MPGRRPAYKSPEAMPPGTGRNVSGRTLIMMSTTKRRLARGIGAGLAAAAALSELAEPE